MEFAHDSQCHFCFLFLRCCCPTNGKDNAECKQETREMFSDASPNSHHAEEGVQLVCVVSERHRINGWKLQEKEIFGSNSELSSNYSCPKM